MRVFPPFNLFMSVALPLHFFRQSFVGRECGVYLQKSHLGINCSNLALELHCTDGRQL